MSQQRRVGPSKTIKRQPIARCGDCGGDGIIKGLFHEMPCNHCEGAGIVHGETGEAMDPQDVILQLRLRLNQVSKVVRQLKAKIPPDGEDRGYGAGRRGYGPGGQRYHGD